MKRIVQVLWKLVATFILLGTPYAVSAAFNFTSWMGWPTFITGGVIWFFVLVLITDAIKRDSKRKELKDADDYIKANIQPEQKQP